MDTTYLKFVDKNDHQILVLLMSNLYLKVKKNVLLEKGKRIVFESTN